MRGSFPTISLAGALAFAALLVGFALSLGASSAAGAGCPSFRVLHDDRIGPAVLPAGNYTVTVAPSSGLTCPAASKLFTRFLGSPGGRLPFPWRLQNQTATFFKPEHPARSAFRVEPVAGSTGSAGASPS